MRRIVQSPPVRLHWFGWQARLIDLQRAGWSISVEEDYMSQSVAIAIKHGHYPIRGLSSRFDQRIISEDRYFRSGGFLPLEVSMQLANKIEIASYTPPPMAYHPIDAEPSMVDMRRYDLDELVMFRPMPEAAEDIIVAPPTFDELMAQMLDMQAPKQKEIREKKRRESRIIQPNIGAILRVA